VFPYCFLKAEPKKQNNNLKDKKNNTKFDSLKNGHETYNANSFKSIDCSAKEQGQFVPRGKSMYCGGPWQPLQHIKKCDAQTRDGKYGCKQ
jgi:hypothetical protein